MAYTVVAPRCSNLVKLYGAYAQIHMLQHINFEAGEQFSIRCIMNELSALFQLHWMVVVLSLSVPQMATRVLFTKVVSLPDTLNHIIQKKMFCLLSGNESNCNMYTPSKINNYAGFQYWTKLRRVCVFILPVLWTFLVYPKASCTEQQMCKWMRM